MLEVLGGHVFVHGVALGQGEGHVQHRDAEEGHPRGAVCLGEQEEQLEWVDFGGDGNGRFKLVVEFVVVDVWAVVVVVVV